MRRTLYVTIDGVLDHLGYSQVVRVIEALATGGFPYSLVSLERSRDLANLDRVALVRRGLAARGIRWEHARYEEGSARGTARNLARLTRLATRIAREEPIGLVHARGYHGALVAQALRARGLPYVFDARAAWIDERLEEGRWFTTPARLAVARWVERRMYRDARAIVTLTTIHADEVARLAAPDAPPPLVVPTCADYDAFQIRPQPARSGLPEAALRALEGRLVLAIVGSLNRSYLGDETAQLTALVTARRPDARVLLLTAQADPWRACLARAGVPEDRVVAVRADHEAMPAWLSLASWGLLVLRADTPAKRGSMPTKLAEFFAAGVRPVVHGCNTEVRHWVDVAGTGVVMRSLDAADMERAASVIAAATPPGDREHGRAATEAHFSLRTGVARYRDLLEELTRRDAASR